MCERVLQGQDIRKELTLFPATGKIRAGQRNSDIKSKFCSWFSASKQQLRIVPETCEPANTPIQLELFKTINQHSVPNTWNLVFTLKWMLNRPYCLSIECFLLVMFSTIHSNYEAISIFIASRNRNHREKIGLKLSMIIKWISNETVVVRQKTKGREKIFPRFDYSVM